jgi:DNA-binding CsgD family transcriptional regulator
MNTTFENTAQRTKPLPGLDPSYDDALTPRETEIARLASLGLTNKEIGQTLDISHWTVGAHMRRIFSKLKVKRRAAIQYALTIRGAA